MFARILSILFVVVIPLPAAAQRVEVEPESLKPGLIAEYRSLAEASNKLTRNEAKPAFFLGHSSPDPRLPTGPSRQRGPGSFISARKARSTSALTPVAICE
jgi:hypothetical protein